MKCLGCQGELKLGRDKEGDHLWCSNTKCPQMYLYLEQVVAEVDRLTAIVDLQRPVVEAAVTDITDGDSTTHKNLRRAVEHYEAAKVSR